MNEDCNICKELQGLGSEECGLDYLDLIRTNKNLVLASENFSVIPSVGPLNNTHVMLVPNKHANSFAELSIDLIKEATQILERLQDHINKKTGEEIFFFESGAGRLTSHSGGCITHAHIHCIRKSEKFFERLSAEVSLSKVETMNFNDADTMHGYIWFNNSQRNSYLCNAPLLPSQFLRYIYAQTTNTPNIWNWRRHTNFTAIKEVLETYKGLIQ